MTNRRATPQQPCLEWNPEQMLRPDLETNCWDAEQMDRRNIVCQPCFGCIWERSGLKTGKGRDVSKYTDKILVTVGTGYSIVRRTSWESSVASAASKATCSSLGPRVCRPYQSPVLPQQYSSLYSQSSCYVNCVHGRVTFPGIWAGDKPVMCLDPPRTRICVFESLPQGYVGTKDALRIYASYPVQLFRSNALPQLGLPQAPLSTSISSAERSPKQK